MEVSERSETSEMQIGTIREAHVSSNAHSEHDEQEPKMLMPHMRL